MKKIEITNLKWIGRREVLGGVGLRRISGVGLRLTSGLGVQLNGLAGGSKTSSFGGYDVEDQGLAAVKQGGESLIE